MDKRWLSLPDLLDKIEQSEEEGWDDLFGFEQSVTIWPPRVVFKNLKDR